jgi:pSer/pThr/pTyr-binding forkhead associated (FHA) protein
MITKLNVGLNIARISSNLGTPKHLDESFLSFFDEEGEKKTLSLEGKCVWTMGRAENSDIRISSTTVSRNHAELRLDENNTVYI